MLDFINDTPAIRLLATKMFQDIPTTDPTGAPQVRDYTHMLQLINNIISKPPFWSDAAEAVGLIGFPINAIIDWPMGTLSGCVLFRHSPQFNAQMRLILN
jgi:phosphatidylserine decarboxylase